MRFVLELGGRPGEARLRLRPLPPAVAAFIRRTLVVAFGYGVAVGTATVVTVAHMLLPTVLPDDGAMGSFYGQMRDLPMFLMGGLMITSYAALPGFLAVVALGHRYRWRDWPRFMLAGALNVFPALWLFGGFGGIGGDGLFFTFCCLGGGLAGGFSYWLVAERPRAAAQRACAVRILRAKAENTPAKR